MKYIPLMGRILFSAIFILSSFRHFTGDLVGYAAAQGTPMPGFLVPLAGMLILLGGLSILLGYKARGGACFIILFLVPVTLIMHRFWDVPDPQAAMQQQINFMKNLSLLGGALYILYFGSGPVSLDETPKPPRRQGRSVPIDETALLTPGAPGARGPSRVL